MATRVFAVDLGAWSVKLATASPGIRGATLEVVPEAGHIAQLEQPERVNALLSAFGERTA